MDTSGIKRGVQISGGVRMVSKRRGFLSLPIVEAARIGGGERCLLAGETVIRHHPLRMGKLKSILS